MKRLVVLPLLALVIASGVARAEFCTNWGGTASLSQSGISFSGSKFRHCQSFGSLTLSTGPLDSGTLAGGGSFSSVGSSFIIGDGELFNGTFVGETYWTLIGINGKKLVFALGGNIEGTDSNGNTVTGWTRQIISTTEENLARGIGRITDGQTCLGDSPPRKCRGPILAPRP